MIERKDAKAQRRKEPGGNPSNFHDLARIFQAAKAPTGERRTSPITDSAPIAFDWKPQRKR